MIQKFVDKFMEQKQELESIFSEKHPDDYKEIVINVIKIITDEDVYDVPDPERIHEIDDGDYQGTLVFIIGGTGYQPSDYWSVMIGYGSCSGCDTLEAIRGYSDDKPTKEQIKDYMTLSLHIVQGLSKMNEEVVY